jgi:hypothetical protein
MAGSNNLGTDFNRIGGVGVMGFISPMNTNDTYAVIDPMYGIDGLRNVNTLGQLNLIPEERRRAGMIVGVLEEDAYFKLKNVEWTYEATDWSELNLINKGDNPLSFQFIDKETPDGITDGINQSFFIQQIPLEGSEHIYLNGLLQEADFDYILNDNEIIFIEPPLSGMRIKCSYRY